MQFRPTLFKGQLFNLSGINCEDIFLDVYHLYILSFNQNLFSLLFLIDIYRK